MPLARVRTIWTGVAGTPWYSNLHFLIPEGYVYQDLAGAVGQFYDDVADYQDSDVSWATEPEVIQLDATTGQPIQVHIINPESGTGSNTGDMVPRATQALLRLSTGFFASGRQVQGKIFLPGFVESTNVGDGVPDTATMAALALSATTNLMSETGATLVVYSPTKRIAPTVTLITGSPEWAVLRSRRD